jgi:hypothetical protein
MSAGSEFFKKEHKEPVSQEYLHIQYDEEKSASKSSVQLRMFERAGVQIVIAKQKEDGSFSFTEKRIHVDSSGKRVQLPVGGFSRTGENIYEREYKIEPSKAYSYVILDEKTFAVDNLPKYLSLKNGKKVPAEQDAQSNAPIAEARPSTELQFRLVVANNHYFGAEKAQSVIAAGDVTYDAKGQVIAIDNKAGGYFVRTDPTDPKYDANWQEKNESVERAIASFGIKCFQSYKPEKPKPFTPSNG